MSAHLRLSQDLVSFYGLLVPSTKEREREGKDGRREERKMMGYGREPW